MRRRTISMLIVACMVISMLAAISAPVMAAAGDLPGTMWVSPTEANGIPVRIELNKPSGSSGGCGGGGGWPGGGGGGTTSSTDYNLFLPGNADISECFFSWDDGLEAFDGENTYASGELPVPAPGEKKTFTFTNEAGATAQFDVTVYQGSETVPPVFIEIDESQGTIAAMNNDQDHETTCTGVLYADGKEYAMPKIKGRGNSSWMMANTKKPYNVSLDVKTNLLGIDSAKTKKWSLLANSNEPSLLRNKLGYDMAHSMGIGLDSAEADVWMNGKYLGTYLITPKYDSFVPKDGFLIENDNYKEDPVEEGGDPSFDLEGLIGQGSSAQYYNYNRITVKKIGDNLLGGEETVETLNAAGEQIRVYTQEVWDAIRSEDGYNSQGGYYADYIDMRSWAAMYLMQDYVKNYDFCGGSIFFHREGQTDADKLFAGPLWDLDIGFGCPENSPTLGRNLDLLDGTGWFVRDVADTKTSIFKVVGKHEDFMEEVTRVYNLYRNVFDSAPEHLETLAQSIQASAEMNYVVTSNESTPTVNITRQTTKQQGTAYEQVYVPTTSWRAYVDNVKTFATARSAFFHDNLSDGSDEGFPALFQLGANSSVTVYDTQDLSGEGTENPTSVYARTAETGEIDITGEGQINFKVNLKSGFRIKSVTAEPAENYKNLKGPADTGVENAYRITKVTGPLTIKIETEEIVCEHEFVDGVCTKCGVAAMQATFVCDEGISIDVYKSQAADSEVFENVTSAFPRSSTSGEIDISGEGQVNFVVHTADGYKLESITAEPASNYKNFKGPADTLVPDGYRITKMTGNVTVTIKASKPEGGCVHDYQAVKTPATCTAQGFTTYTCSKCGDTYDTDYTAKIPHSYQDGVCTVCGEKLLNVTISCDGGASVTVLETQKADGPKTEKAVNANPRDGDTGLIDCSGEGQVNFIVILTEGYSLESITAEPSGNYKNLKGPADTGIENGYRITKVKGDFTITVRTRLNGEPPCEHDYLAVKTPATCTAQGFTTYTCSKCGDTYDADYTAKIPHSYQDGVCIVCGEKLLNVTISCDDGASVTVLETQKPDGPKTEKAVSANPRDGDTGLIDCSGEGQVNFIVKLAQGYDLESITAEPSGSYKNLKAPADTGIENGYRITKVKGDFTITVRTKLNGEPPCEHDYQAVVTAPTCTEKGFTTYTCSKCGDSYTGDETAALGHDFQNGVCTRCGEKAPVDFRFEDVSDPAKFYFDPVYWAYYADPQITNGTDATHFGPDNACTRGHVVTFLWRAAGCPEPKSAQTPFKDLKKGAFYEKAVAWAVENEITNGMSADKFAPDATCTRGQIVTFLWRYKGKPEPKNAETPFKDLKEGGFYLDAVAWAVENEVTNGLSSDKFGPDAVCTRGQVVTFLYRATGE